MNFILNMTCFGGKVGIVGLLKQKVRKSRGQKGGGIGKVGPTWKPFNILRLVDKPLTDQVTPTTLSNFVCWAIKACDKLSTPVIKHVFLTIFTYLSTPILSPRYILPECPWYLPPVEQSFVLKYKICCIVNGNNKRIYFWRQDRQQINPLPHSTPALLCLSSAYHYQWYDLSICIGSYWVFHWKFNPQLHWDIHTTYYSCKKKPMRKWEILPQYMILWQLLVLYMYMYMAHGHCCGSHVP